MLTWIGRAGLANTFLLIILIVVDKKNAKRQNEVIFHLTTMRTGGPIGCYSRTFWQELTKKSQSLDIAVS
jgi:hypothetical protein